MANKLKDPVTSAKKITNLLYAAIISVLIICAVPFAGGCGGASSSNAESPAKAAENSSANNEESTSSGAQDGTYKAPAFKNAVYHEDAAEGDGVMFIDTSAVSEGYVGVSAVSDARVKFQVIMGENTYNYDISSDGTPSVFPLQCGDGTYSFRIMENIVDKKYALAFETSADVVLISEFEPYLRPSAYSDYNESSQCVQMAAGFAKSADTQVDIISQVYDYVCSHIKYDTPKAESIQSGYMPNPDETLRTGMGICFDYASLAAAMLRSQGIPTKIIFGYVAPDDLYHAWNMFYTEDTGWITVEFRADPSDWTRMDLTFSANGSDGNFIGNGTNYSDVYYY